MGSPFFVFETSTEHTPFKEKYINLILGQYSACFNSREVMGAL